MNILAIIASPRGRQGNTGRLLDEVLAGAEEAGAVIEIVSLSKSRVLPCVGCEVCHKTGICSIKDDYESIKDKLLACDAFVLATPNYIFSVTAQMKALFDRMNGLIHCMALEGKYALAVETSGGGEDEEVLSYMGRFINSLGAEYAGGIGSPMAGVRTFPNENELFDKARALGRDLCLCVTEKRTFPDQDGFRQAFKARMSGLVDLMQEYWHFEADYWRKKGDLCR